MRDDDGSSNNDAHVFALMDADGAWNDLIAGVSVVDERIQGNGCQQKRPPYSGGDAGVYARGQQIGPAAVEVVENGQPSAACEQMFSALPHVAKLLLRYESATIESA